MKTCVAERALRHNLPCRANVSTTLVGDGMDITREMSGPTKQVVVRHLLAGPLVRAKLLFLFASFVSPILSVSLCFSGHQLQDLFVGIWSHLSWRRERWSSAVTSADHEPNPVVQHRGRHLGHHDHRRLDVWLLRCVVITICGHCAFTRAHDAEMAKSVVFARHDEAGVVVKTGNYRHPSGGPELQPMKCTFVTMGLISKLIFCSSWP